MSDEEKSAVERVREWLAEFEAGDHAISCSYASADPYLDERDRPECDCYLSGLDAAREAFEEVVRALETSRSTHLQTLIDNGEAIFDLRTQLAEANEKVTVMTDATENRIELARVPCPVGNVLACITVYRNSVKGNADG